MAGHTDNEIVIAAPPALVWEMANDVEAWPDLFVDEYASGEILELTPERVRFRLTTVPRNGAVYSWVSERYLDPGRGTVIARRVEPGPFYYMHLFQSFTSVEEGTRLRWVQDFQVRPDAPFTEAEFQERIDRGSKANLERHRSVIEGRLAASVAGKERDR
jgi:aromatase